MIRCRKCCRELRKRQGLCYVCGSRKQCRVCHITFKPHGQAKTACPPCCQVLENINAANKLVTQSHFTPPEIVRRIEVYRERAALGKELFG